MSQQEKVFYKRLLRVAVAMGELTDAMEKMDNFFGEKKERRKNGKSIRKHSKV